MRDGRVQWVSYSKYDKELLRQNRKAVVKVQPDGQALGLIAD